MANDTIGYGKPPKHSQFKSGTSGNPKGRPKGKVSLVKLLERHVDGKMTVVVGGQKKLMTRREALIRGVVNDALKGKDKVRKHLLDLLLLNEARNPELPIEANTLEDEAIIQSLLQRHGVNQKLKTSKLTNVTNDKVKKAVK